MKPTNHRFLTRTLTYVLIVAGSLHASLTSNAESISPEDAHAIGVEAYLDFSSVRDDGHHPQTVTTSSEPRRVPYPPISFAIFPAYPTGDMRVVVRPNFDTPISVAGLSYERTCGRFSAGH